jgi:uncharacterized membrane protein YagU involved in acid resistance
MIMSDIAFAHPDVEVLSLRRPRAFDTIVYGGLTAGVMDISYAIIFFGIRNGAKPARVLQSVASGLLGRDAARAGGMKTALLGLALHFLNALIIATIFFSASLILRTLIRQAVICGLLYGVAVYFVMNYIVIPLSAIGPSTSSIPWAVFLSGLIVHAFLIGLPIALFAKRSAKSN